MLSAPRKDTMISFSRLFRVQTAYVCVFLGVLRVLKEFLRGLVEETSSHEKTNRSKNGHLAKFASWPTGSEIFLLLSSFTPEDVHFLPIFCIFLTVFALLGSAFRVDRPTSRRSFSFHHPPQNWCFLVSPLGRGSRSWPT